MILRKITGNRFPISTPELGRTGDGRICQSEVMRTGLAADWDAAILRLANKTNAPRGAQVLAMDMGPG